jgi:hypothetical protein
VGLRRQNNSKITLQKRLHVNTLIAEPGTGEIDFSSVYSFSSGDSRLPDALRYTPAGTSIPWGRTEYSVAFDSLTTADVGGGRVAQFSESLTFAATAVVLDGKKLDIAIAPQAVFFLRNEEGARYGAIAIARYDTGGNSIGATLGWSTATHASADNLAGTWDAGAGFGRRLGASGLLGMLTPHANFVCEKSTGAARALSVFEGIELQLTQRLAFDISAKHFDLRGTPGHQVVAGLNLSLSRKH